MACLIGASTLVQAKGKVHTIGDSTMAFYDEGATVTRGWGMYLQQFLQGITVNNRGKAGASSKSFYLESAYWASVKQQLTPGDYVFIQFSHNDEKSNGVDGDELKAYYRSLGTPEGDSQAAATDYRGTRPTTTYRQYLTRYVDETRAAGCVPVFVGPICRMYFSGDTINRAGQHDLGDRFDQLTPSGLTQKNRIATTDHSMDYVYQMKQVADSLGVAYLDLTAATRRLYESYGNAPCHKMLSDGNGHTHLNTTGATLIARLCAQLMQREGILADHVRLTSSISVSPSEADLGEAYKGQTLTKEFALSGFDLRPASGVVTVQGSPGLQLSTDQTTWTSSCTLPYDGANLVSTFYARCALPDGKVNEQITVSSADTTIVIPVSARGISLTAGTEARAVWRLESHADCVAEGPVEVLPQTLSNMYVQRYSQPNAKVVWPDKSFDVTRKMQRNLIVGDRWPGGEIDEVSDRYIEFAVTPSRGTQLRVDSIGMYLCGAGGSGMMCHVNYSTEPHFANQHTIFSSVKMEGNVVYPVSATPVISLHEGDTLRVRIYPWYNTTTEALGKTICVSDVVIRGRAVDASTDGIGAAVELRPATLQAVYGLDGHRLSHPRRGVNVLVYADAGKMRTVKRLIP